MYIYKQLYRRLRIIRIQIVKVTAIILFDNRPLAERCGETNLQLQLFTCPLFSSHHCSGVLIPRVSQLLPCKPPVLISSTSSKIYSYLARVVKIHGDIYYNIICSPFFSITAAFTLHPRNVTTLYDRTVVFTCSYTTTNSQPQWLIAPENGAFGLTQTLTFPTSQGLYSYHTATALQAQVSVRALTNTPGLNNTCFSCRFINAGLVESGRGCLIIACELYT